MTVKQAIALFTLNVLDCVFTIRIVAQGATEVNPLMAVLLHQSPVLFAFAKMGLICLSMFLFYKAGKVRDVRNYVQGAIGLYAAIVVWHLILMRGP